MHFREATGQNDWPDETAAILAKRLLPALGCWEGYRMNRGRRAMLAATAVAVILSSSAYGAPTRRPLVALELETRENTLDGCTACGCRAKGGLEPGEAGDWWVTFGSVRSGDGGGLIAEGRSSHCGIGSFEDIASDFTGTVGTPYVILHLTTAVADGPAEEVSVETRLSLQKLTGFDEMARPVYLQSAQERAMSFSDEGEMLLPLLVADPREKENLRVHEVVVRMRASALNREGPTSFGTVSVSADVPGAEILLDGGLVGLVAEGAPIVLRNVRAGRREIRVRDHSGREARRELSLESGDSRDVALEILEPVAGEAIGGLVPVGENPQGFKEFWRARDGVLMIAIPEGEFLMGSPEGQGEPHEQPQHRVHVSEFLIDKTEVTWRQFRKYAEATGAKLPREPVSGSPDDYPVSFVLWEEARSYCEWAGARLPTEAEWEKAARGTDGRAYPWGDDWQPLCNSISGGLHQVESVGSYPDCVSPYGVLDMSGSMWEWCADKYGEGYYAASPPRDPAGPDHGRLHVKRGGAWMSQPLWTRAAYRGKASPTSRNADHGFRCAQDAPE